MVVLSPEKADFSEQLVKMYRIEFPVLRDFHNEVAIKFGILYTLPNYLDALYRQFGNDPMEWNDTQTWQLPLPARFIIDPAGTIVDVDVDADYTVRPEPDTILEVLRTLKTRT
jgi:peroxiredoxin